MGGAVAIHRWGMGCILGTCRSLRTMRGLNHRVEEEAGLLKSGGSDQESVLDMTTANKVTFARIALIPVFVCFAIYYGMGHGRGEAEEWLRWAAVGAFALASASDGLDGYIARRFNQRTELGVILDPIADKSLLMAGIITLSFSGWPLHLPVWFAVLVVGRDLMVMLGALVLILLQGRAAVRTTWTGKTATAMQMILLSLVMLQPEFLRSRWLWNRECLEWCVWMVAGFTAISGIGYLGRVIGQVHLGGHGDPTPWPSRAQTQVEFTGSGGEDSRST
jgi:cardiolipin synthase